MKKKFKEFFDKTTTLATMVLMMFSAMPMSVSAEDMPEPPTMPYVMITEIVAFPDSGSEWVELWVPGGDSVNINGWTMREISGDTEVEFVEFTSDTIIPAGGFYTYDLPYDMLNNDVVGDSVSLWDNTGREIDRFSWAGQSFRSVPNWPALPDATPDPGTSFAFIHGDWEMVSPPTKGAPNFPGMGGDQTPFDVIDKELSDKGVETNLGEYDDYSSVKDLYFQVKGQEGVPYGRITFSNTLDLSDPSMLDLLSDLYLYLDAGPGRMGLASKVARSLGVLGAEITMYNLPFGTMPEIEVFDDEGNPSMEDISIRVLSYVNNGRGGFDLTFTVDHFTTFVAVPAADSTPPAAPTGLTIKDSLGNDIGCEGYTNERDITIDWDSNTEPDFSHYQLDLKDKDNHRQPTESFYDATIRDEDGYYKYRIWAVDMAGNRSTTSSGWCGVTLDRVVPEVNINRPGVGYASGKVKVKVTVQDENLSKTVLVIKNTDTTVSYTARVDKSGYNYANEMFYKWNTAKYFGDGNYRLTLKAWDKVGHKVVDIVKPVVVDNTPIKSSIRIIDRDKYVGDGFMASGDAAVAVKTKNVMRGEEISYRLYNQGGRVPKWEKARGPLDLKLRWRLKEPFTEGYKVVILETRDAAGNVSKSKAKVYVDRTSPTATVDTMSEYSNSAPFDVAFSASDLSTASRLKTTEATLRRVPSPASGVDYVELWFRKDGGAWRQYCEIDASGDVGSLESRRRFKVDCMFGPNESPISFDPEVAELLYGTEYSGDGLYEFAMVATDKVGNKEKEVIDVVMPASSEVNGDQSFTVEAWTVLDTQAPTITVDPQVVDMFVGDSFNEMDGVSADESVTWSVLMNVNTSVVGTYTVTYDAEDLAGNAAAQVVRTVNVLEVPEVETPAPAAAPVAVVTPADEEEGDDEEVLGETDEGEEETGDVAGDEDQVTQEEEPEEETAGMFGIGWYWWLLLLLLLGGGYWYYSSSKKN